MKTTKKMFKHGRSLAVVVPSEFTQNIDSQEISVEMVYDENNIPSLILKPVDKLDTIENDSAFALFIQTLYNHAMEHPETLKDGSEIWNDRVKELIEGVQIDD